jgi:predicted  nucleic acid-binding Zn-ribbon protein
LPQVAQLSAQRADLEARLAESMRRGEELAEQLAASEEDATAAKALVKQEREKVRAHCTGARFTGACVFQHVT